VSAGFLGEWELDGTLGLVFSLLAVAAALVYLAAAEVGRRRDRRHRRWPLVRTACFLAGIAVLLVATDSGIGAGADEHLTAHMVEHMLIWLVVAPLLVAGAPVRLALFATGTSARHRIARALHSELLTAVTGPVFSTLAFSIVIVATSLPAVFDLTLESDLVHVCEHALYLLTAILVWAPLIGADPLPHRPGPAGRCCCVVACMVPMALVAAWLLAAGAPLYRPYEAALGTAAALHDQRLAGAIMLAAALPAFAVALAAPLAARAGTRPAEPPPRDPEIRAA
jgi:cytochrome c oxidase assembly factor CtaG